MRHQAARVNRSLRGFFREPQLRAGGLFTPDILESQRQCCHTSGLTNTAALSWQLVRYQLLVVSLTAMCQGLILILKNEPIT